MRRIVLLSWVLWMVACGGSGGDDGYSSLIRLEDEPPGENCENGGEAVLVGLDLDRDGTLSDDEVQSTAYVCTPADGDSGATAALVEVSDEPPGETCAAGGVSVSWGHDIDGSGELDEGEVEGKSFVCNGQDGISGTDGSDGTSSLIVVAPVGEGDDCPNGGQAIQTGEDTNQDGVLQSGEVTSTTYVCNGEGGSAHISLMVQSPEAAGENCPAGGIRVDSGVDLDDDGALDDEEIQATTYVCHGLSSLIRVEDEAAGDACPYGGTRVDVGLDDGEASGHAGNGTLDDDEVDDTFYICDDKPPLAGFLMNAGDEDYFAFPDLADFMTGRSWSILETISLPDAPQPGWHFFRGKAWEDKEGDVAMQVRLDEAPPSVLAWIYKSGWVQLSWADDTGDVLRADRVITLCLQYDVDSETAEFYVDGALRASEVIPGGIDDSANTNPLFFGGQSVDPSWNKGDLYTEADVIMIHQAWSSRLMSSSEITQYDGTNFVIDGAAVFATQIGQDVEGDMNFYDAVTGAFATIGNSPEYLVLE